jgi:hypothetical protein
LGGGPHSLGARVTRYRKRSRGRVKHELPGRRRAPAVTGARGTLRVITHPPPILVSNHSITSIATTLCTPPHNTRRFHCPVARTATRSGLLRAPRSPPRPPDHRQDGGALPATLGGGGGWFGAKKLLTSGQRALALRPPHVWQTTVAGWHFVCAGAAPACRPRACCGAPGADGSCYLRGRRARVSPQMSYQSGVLAAGATEEKGETARMVRAMPSAPSGSLPGEAGPSVPSLPGSHLSRPQTRSQAAPPQMPRPQMLPEAAAAPPLTALHPRRRLPSWAQSPLRTWSSPLWAPRAWCAPGSLASGCWVPQLLMGTLLIGPVLASRMRRSGDRGPPAWPSS